MANTANADRTVGLLLSGQRFSQWTAARVTRTIEAISGSFQVELVDGPATPARAVLEEREVSVLLGNDVVLTGYIDTRTVEYTNDSHSLSIVGRDRAGALVDNSAILSSYEFHKLGILEICRKVADPFGVSVSLQDGIADTAISTTGKTKGPSTRNKAPHGGAPGAVGSAGRTSSITLGQPVAKFAINPGDSPYEAIELATRPAGLLAVSDGRGGVVLTRAGASKASTALVEGGNILRARLTVNAAIRYALYVVSGQSVGSDASPGAIAAAVTGSARDPRVARTDRVLMIRPSVGMTREYARSRAAWEASIREARSTTVTVLVQGWEQGDGSLWPVNALVSLDSPKLGIRDEMLITNVTHTFDQQGGSLTELTLAPPGAYQPEPTLSAKSGSGGYGGGDYITANEKKGAK